MPNTAEMQRPQLMPVAQMVDALVDYRTGEIKSPGLDLKDSFRQFVETVKRSEKFTNTGPAIALSPLAAEMIKKYASESNESGKEMAFSIRGVRIREGNKDVLVGAYLAPATWAENRQATQVSVDPVKEEISARRIVTETNLAEYLTETTGSRNGKDFGIGHIHHTGTGKENYGKPSDKDYQQVERYFQSPEFSEYTWLVITKQPDSKFGYTAVYSHRDKNNKIVHDKIKIFESTEPFQEIGENVGKKQ